jgi:ABC-type glycerol-3-phosphate transport system permease component
MTTVAQKAVPFVARAPMRASRVIALGVSGIILVALAAIYLFPFYWMLTTALKSMLEAVRIPPTWWPSEIRFENYAEAWRATNFLHYLKNTVIVTVLTVVGQLLFCVPAAWAFARKQFPFKRILFAAILIDLMLPRQVAFLPIFLTLNDLGWIDTYQGMSIPFMYSAFGIFFMAQTFKQVPDELVEAARLDRAGELQILVSIAVPICRPIILTIALLTFFGKWNDYFWTLVLTNDETVRTLPIAVQGLLDNGDFGLTPWNVVMAGNAMLVAPLIVLYLVTINVIKRAFAYGGIK